MAKLYTIFEHGVPLVTNASLAVAQTMMRQFPAITFAPSDVAIVKYEVYFSTPVMNQASALDLLARSIDPFVFPGYTVVTGTGSWQGQTEPSYTLTVVQEADDAAISRLADGIKHTFAQEAVFVCKTPITSWVVS